MCTLEIYAEIFAVRRNELPHKYIAYTIHQFLWCKQQKQICFIETDLIPV